MYLLSKRTMFSFSSSQYVKCFVGISDQEVEGVWKTRSGVIISYSNWLLDQPDNNNDAEHCIELLTNGYWNDLPCSASRFSLCERSKRKLKLVPFR